MRTFFRLLGLIVLLNLVRYLVGGLIEQLLILPSLLQVMAADPATFNVEFSSADWATSFFYNFMMWAAIVWAFHLMHRALRGAWLSKSLKAFGLMYLFFASLSAIYMNHYTHTKAFYLLNILDALIAFSVVALANAALYPRMIKQDAAAFPAG